MKFGFDPKLVFPSPQSKLYSEMDPDGIVELLTTLISKGIHPVSLSKAIEISGNGSIIRSLTSVSLYP